MMVIEDEEKQAHREAIAIRLHSMDMNARRNISRIPGGGASSDAGVLRRIARIVTSPKNQANKITALWQCADEASRELLPVSACRKGCSHCCHIAVGVPKPEAELIAARTGRKLLKPTVQRGGKRGIGFGDVAWGYDHPCVFLKEGRCSIYSHRPLTCRTHFNFDDDELLCKVTLAPEGNVMPWWGGSRVMGAALMQVCESGGSPPQVADIREWFAEKYV